jgi:hypothetical protein
LVYKKEITKRYGKHEIYGYSKEQIEKEKEKQVLEDISNLM